MRCAGRIIYNVTVVVSLLLCLGTVGVWVRSGWVSDNLTWYDDPIDGIYTHISIVRSSHGGVQFGMWHCFGEESFAWKKEDGSFRYSHRHASKYPMYGTLNDSDLFNLGLSISVRRHSALGFEVVHEAVERSPVDRASFTVLRSLTLPLYFPTLLFALLPAHYVLRVRRRRRMASRLARGC